MIGIELVDGSLGNNMFFIATAFAHAMNEFTDCIFSPNIRKIAPLFSYPFGRGYNGKEEQILASLASIKTYNDPSYGYTPIRWRDNMLLQHGPGYFQSYKYFHESNENDIKSIFSPSKEVKEFILKEYGEAFWEKRNSCFGDTVAVHVRLGDYLQYPHHPVQSTDYYKKAFEYFPGFRTLLVFSNDYERCRNIIEPIGDKRVIYAKQVVEQHSGIVDQTWDYRNGFDMFVMSRCRGHIIANSTYSWWGAYLADSHRVVYPSKWFARQLSHYTTDDLCLPGWIKV